MELVENFLSGLNELIGLECWGVTGGERAGSVISIDIGKKILRKNHLKTHIYQSWLLNIILHIAL